ncbi:MAG: S8 family peptidase, partial [bacterium]|nr:S8 family peptidase [bacterium]
MKKYFIFISILLFIFLFLSGSRTYAQNFSRQIESSSLKPGEAVPGEIIVEYNKGQSPTELRQKVSERAQASKSLFGRVENYASDARAALQGQETPEKMLNEINNVNGKAGIKEKEEILPSIEVIKTTNTISPQALQDMYENLPEVKHAQLNYILKASDISDDTYYPQMWGLAKIQIEQAWNITKGSKDIIIAVIDSGIDYNHEDLPQDIIKGPNYINDTYNPMDDGGHGTHVSGTIGALANNSKGITGIDWQAKIMAIKILGANGEGNTANLIEAIVYAADNGAKVINMSVGVDLGAGTSCLSNDPITQSAITYAKQKKVTIIVAAGNDSKNASTWTPASCNGVLTVGATDPDDKRTAYSNYGNAVKISAPGGDFDQCAVNNQISFSACAPKTILSTFPRAINPCPPGACGGLPDRTYNYALLQGTSMAAPHVAGVAALVLTVNPRL